MTASPESTNVVPFVRWAGSKRLLLGQLLPLLPSRFDRYVEPFLGGGSVYLALRPKVAILNDACGPLVETWNAIRDDPGRVFESATSLALNKENYYVERSKSSGDSFTRAGRFIYLNKGAFNGLYRVNLSGSFNVPWGAPKSQFVVDQGNLERISSLLRSSDRRVTSQDFALPLSEARSGDLVFLDPPYVTSHNSNGFIAYNEKIFSWADQVRLASLAHEAQRRGASVVVSNAHHEAVRQLYPTFNAHTLERSSTLAAAASSRRKVTELVLVSK